MDIGSHHAVDERCKLRGVAVGKRALPHTRARRGSETPPQIRRVDQGTKRPHERSADSWQELVVEIRRTILHEVGHHFGMEEHELPY